MISANTKLIISLEDPFDYKEYTTKGGTDNIGLFYQIAGLVEGGKRINPEDVVAGYIEIIKEMNEAFTTQIKQNQNAPITPQIPKPCNGCGGGKVL